MQGMVPEILKNEYGGIARIKANRSTKQKEKLKGTSNSFLKSIKTVVINL
tara:strand:+ start:61 stop:210 length:150 start_codon:yes stop_codon:yes gene_type:complete